MDIRIPASAQGARPCLGSRRRVAAPEGNSYHPGMRLELDPEAGAVSFALDAELYPLETVEGAAHAFAERARVLFASEDGVLELTLEPLARLDEAGLRALAGEFLNEALSHCLRRRRLAENARLNRFILTTAFHAARRDAADPLQPKAAEAGELTAEQRAEADRLQREAEGAR